MFSEECKWKRDENHLHFTTERDYKMELLMGTVSQTYDLQYKQWKKLYIQTTDGRILILIKIYWISVPVTMTFPHRATKCPKQAKSFDHCDKDWGKNSVVYFRHKTRFHLRKYVIEHVIYKWYVNYSFEIGWNRNRSNINNASDWFEITWNHIGITEISENAT